MYLLDGGCGDGEDVNVDEGRGVLLKYTQMCFCSQDSPLSLGPSSFLTEAFHSHFLQEG